MIPVFLSLIALVAYAFGGINGSILVSRRVFGQDVRRLGSRNASYANFVQVFGPKWGMAVLGVDALKTAIPVLGGMLLMKIPGTGYPVLGALFAGFCCVLGDCYPWRFRFKGNKGVVGCAVALLLADWRAGLVALAFYVVAIAFSRMASLASLVMAFSGAILCWCFIPATQMKGMAGLLALFTALVMALRQRQSIGRILAGTEPRIRWGKRADDKMKEDRF